MDGTSVVSNITAYSGRLDTFLITRLDCVARHGSCLFCHSVTYVVYTAARRVAYSSLFIACVDDIDQFCSKFSSS